MGKSVASFPAESTTKPRLDIFGLALTRRSGGASMAPIKFTNADRVKPAVGRSATTRPSTITMVRVQTAMISSRRCVIRMQAVPVPAACLMWISNCRVASCPRADVGSSRMAQRTGLSVTLKARAISTICRVPIGRFATLVSSGMPWPGKISSKVR